MELIKDSFIYNIIKIIKVHLFNQTLSIQIYDPNELLKVMNFSFSMKQLFSMMQL